MGNVRLAITPNSYLDCRKAEWQQYEKDDASPTIQRFVPYESTLSSKTYSTKLLPRVLSRQRRGDRPATLVAECQE
jgi:hypothetical protein